jgi:serine/threonine-protein kinase
VVFGGLTLHRWLPDSASFHPARETAMTAQWMLIAVGVSTVTSAVIYRLRQSVHEACKLGQYTLEQKLGEGGMGIVYRARHALLRRPTAVKLLRPESASDAAVTRFEREVQQTSRLTHPNTIAIYDYGRTPDWHLLLRDGVPGGTRPPAPGA